MALDGPISTSISSFDNLANEIVLCVFEYLTPIEQYRAFFHYNSRLRLCVKQWTEYSRKGLNADIQRYSTLHSWYKHLSFLHGGTRFYILPARGQEQRNIFHTRVADKEQLHWHFVRDLNYINDERIRTIIVRYPIFLNPFFYHSARRSDKTQWRIFYGGIIIMEYCQDEIIEWLHENYPQSVANILNAYKTCKRLDYCLVPIFDNEWTKTLATVQNAADHIWNELKDLDDINIFDI
jgi:hypothetical protein